MSETPPEPTFDRYVLRCGTGAGPNDHDFILDVHHDAPAITESYEWTGTEPAPTLEQIEQGWTFVPPTYPAPITWTFTTMFEVLTWLGYQTGARPEYSMHGPARVLPTNWDEHMN